MKKFACLFSLTALSALSLLSSCTKRDEQAAPDPALPQLSLARVAGTGPDDAANPANPQDSVGFYHNYGLQAMRSVWTKPGVTRQQCYDALVVWCHDNDFPVNITASGINSLVSTIQSDTPNKCANFVSSSGLTSAQGKYYENQIMDMGFHLSSYASYSDYKAAMITLEAKIMNDQAVTASDKQKVLCSASVARHSVLYWAREAHGDNENPSTNSNPCALRFWDKVKNWWNNIDWGKVAVCDVGGAIGGAAGGWIGAACGALGASIAGTV